MGKNKCLSLPYDEEKVNNYLQSLNQYKTCTIKPGELCPFQESGCVKRVLSFKNNDCIKIICGKEE